MKKNSKRIIIAGYFGYEVGTLGISQEKQTAISRTAGAGTMILALKLAESQNLAAGAAGGAVLGGTGAGTSVEAGRQISRDLATKNLENRVVNPGMLGRGFLFFPGEAPSAGQLRLQLMEQDSGMLHTLNFVLK